MNNLVTTVTPLLTLLIQLRQCVIQQNVQQVQEQIIEEIRSIDHKLTKFAYSARTIVATRYCLCTAIDESILSQTWGQQSVWAEQSLLSVFHKERWGGERFYIILEDMAKQPNTNVDFLEFAYILLSLGFEGKYYGEQISVRDEIRKRVFYRISQIAIKPNKCLSYNLPEVHHLNQKKPSMSYALFFIIAFVFMSLLINAYYNYEVSIVAAPVYNQLHEIADVSPIDMYFKDRN